MRELLEEISRIPKGQGDGSPKALAEGHLAFVVQIARGMHRPAGVLLDDLVSAGFVGLMKATKAFNPEEAKFTTYAKLPIRLAILRYLASSPSAAIRTPEYAGRAASRISRGKEVSPREERAAEALATARRTVSLDRIRASQGSAFDPPSRPSDPSEVEFDGDVQAASLKAALGVLSEVQRRVIEGAFADPPKSRREMGEEIGATPYQVGLIRGAAIRRLRKEMGVVPAKNAAIEDPPPPLEADPCIDCGTTGGFTPRTNRRPARPQGRCIKCATRHGRSQQRAAMAQRRAAS